MVFLFFCQIYLGAAYSYDADLFLKQPVVGTWAYPGGRISERSFACIVKASLRKNKASFEILDDLFDPNTGELSHYLLPPRKFSIYRVQSQYLGNLFYIFDIGLRAVDEDPSIIRELEFDIEEKFKTQGRADDYPFDDCYQNRNGYDAEPAASATTRWYDVPVKTPQLRKPTSTPTPKTPDLTTLETVSPLAPIPTNQILVIRDAPQELVLLSSPRQGTQGLPSDLPPKIKGTFYNWGMPGNGVVVYVLDTGCDRSHPEFKNANFEDWIDIGRFPLERGTDVWQNYHGSIMSAHISGDTVGVSQYAGLVNVPFFDGTLGFELTTALEVLAKTFDHIKSNNSHRPCILNLSWGFNLGDDIPFIRALFGDILKELTNLGNVIIVTSAGNDSPATRITKVPTIYGYDKSFKNLVVAGAVDPVNFANLLQSDTMLTNMVWALGQSVTELQQPDLRLDPRYLQRSDYYAKGYGGTSAATATTSGLLAVFLSQNLNSKAPLDEQVSSAVEKLKTISFPRKEGGVPIIHNGFTPDDWPKRDQKLVGYKSKKGKSRCILLRLEKYLCF
ncbi:hypothetical protein TWF694_011172 [Orbilia ellipsospora]|uniref:Peptidase S8/S53 domain-containing protein n=1 Tax=Orbilia ellipsospora TaxID=2528407 RepID=A0AAV9XEI5_9PEZI